MSNYPFKTTPVNDIIIDRQYPNINIQSPYGSPQKNSQYQEYNSNNQGHHFELANEYHNQRVSKHTEYFGEQGNDNKEEDEYDALKIPADWNIAQDHADAHKTGPQQQDASKLCKCCGYVVERKQLKICTEVMDLSFIGSGFPCFYNFLKWCFVSLILFILSNGIYNIYTNYEGTFCNHPEILHQAISGAVSLTTQQAEKQAALCHDVFFHKVSLANKIGHYDELEVQSKLNILTMSIMMVIMVFVRKQNKEIDSEIDMAIVTPADYTIIVKNIPRKLKIDYEKELEHIFTHNAVHNTTINVAKIVLVYDIDYLLELEEKLELAIARKQKFLNIYGFRKDDPAYEDLDHEIEHMEHRIKKVEENIPNDPSKYFTGIAFVSFQTEQEKRQVIEANQYTWQERFLSFINHGKLKNPQEHDLTWDDNKLFIEESPEPDDIDWEFIHYSTKRKIIARLKADVLSVLFMTSCYLAIWSVVKFQGILIEESYVQAVKGKVEEIKFIEIKCLSFFISMGIVMFNKFVLGKVFHMIVDAELYSTKSKFNIGFANRLTFALFLNSALITYFVEILGSNNYYGPGGFIYTESFVFLWNCLVPPSVWFIDPWTIQKDYIRKSEMKKRSQNKCYLTQKQLNQLMEKVEYTQGKRYADNLKTMWFTFFYGSCIPIGLFFSAANIIMYYWIDKYNVLRRRTIKESLAMEVSVHMVENLEYCIVWFAIGNITFQYQLFGQTDVYCWIMLIMSLVYINLPIQEINEYIFKFENSDEVINYDDAKIQFKTDYDRENPILKHEAIHKWNKQFKCQHMNILKKGLSQMPILQQQGGILLQSKSTATNNIISPVGNRALLNKKK